MRSKLTLLIAFLVGGLAGTGLGCQAYDFEPVEPLAIAQTTKYTTIKGQQRKPNLMLLVDKSGSMDEPVDPADPDCTVGGNLCGLSPKPLCPFPSCPTRWTDLKSAMGNFLQANGSVARMGLMTYPATSDVCAAPTSVRIELSTSDDVNAELQTKADEIRTTLLNISSRNANAANSTGGGTPTSLSLKQLGDYPPLDDVDREDFILLLTDGLPNCNPNFSESSCSCTLPSQSLCNPGGGYEQKGCLDRQASVDEVSNLFNKKIKTIVIGFGAEVANAGGAVVLNAMASAGGFARQCDVNGSCGPSDTCDTATGLCGRRFYQAGNATELAAALNAIVGVINPKACEHSLDSVPSDPRLLSVIWNGDSLPSGPDTWTYGAGTVTFHGTRCDQLLHPAPGSQVNLEFRVLEAL